MVTSNFKASQDYIRPYFFFKRKIIKLILLICFIDLGFAVGVLVLRQGPVAHRVTLQAKLDSNLCSYDIYSLEQSSEGKEAIAAAVMILCVHQAPTVQRWCPVTISGLKKLGSAPNTLRGCSYNSCGFSAHGMHTERQFLMCLGFGEHCALHMLV